MAQIDNLKFETDDHFRLNLTVGRFFGIFNHVDHNLFRILTHITTPHNFEIVGILCDRVDTGGKIDRIFKCQDRLCTIDKNTRKRLDAFRKRDNSPLSIRNKLSHSLYSIVDDQITCTEIHRFHVEQPVSFLPNSELFTPHVYSVNGLIKVIEWMKLFRDDLEQICLDTWPGMEFGGQRTGRELVEIALRNPQAAECIPDARIR